MNNGNNWAANYCQIEDSLESNKRIQLDDPDQTKHCAEDIRLEGVLVAGVSQAGAGDIWPELSDGLRGWGVDSTLK